MAALPDINVLVALEQIPKEISKWPRAASRAILKELLGKGLARRGVSAVLRRQAKPWWEERVPPLSWDWPASAPCQRPLGAATISEIFSGFALSFAGRYCLSPPTPTIAIAINARVEPESSTDGGAFAVIMPRRFAPAHEPSRTENLLISVNPLPATARRKTCSGETPNTTR